jgi:septal ring factor EnvC (AmiA/AmiB activator)
METAVQKPKTRISTRKIALLATILFFASLGGLLYLQNANWNLGEVLSESRLQQEKLMSEKLELERSVAKFKSDLNKMGTENKGLSARISDQLAELEAAEKTTKKLRSTASQVDALKKQKGELEAMKRGLEKDMAKMSGTIADLTAENSRSRIENQDLASRNSKLNEVSE